MHFIVILLIFASFAAAQTPGVRPLCPINEVYTNCFNSCSERKCPMLNTTPVICPTICYRGCTCRPGYVRNTSGRCVSPSQCPPPNPCSRVRCRSGYVCQVIQGRAQCVPAPPRLTCANALCMRGYFCVMVRPINCNSPTCEVPSCVTRNPCLTTRCMGGMHCILRQVVCIRAPCNPVAECVRF